MDVISLKYFKVSHIPFLIARSIGTTSDVQVNVSVERII